MATEELSPEEQGKRLRIARELADVSRAELGTHFAQDPDFKKGDVAAIERQATRANKKVRRVPFTPRRRKLAAEVLGVPEAFFTEPNYRKLFSLEPSEDRLERLRQELETRLQILEEATGVARAVDVAETEVDPSIQQPGEEHPEPKRANGHQPPPPAAQGGQS